MRLRERLGVRVPLVLMDSWRRGCPRSRRCAVIRGIEATSRRTSCRAGSPSWAPTTCSRSRGRRTRAWNGCRGPRRPYAALVTSGMLAALLDPATARRSSRTPTTSARCSTPDPVVGAAEESRSRWRSPGAPRPTARAARSRGGARRPRAARDCADARGGLASLQTSRASALNTNNLWVDLGRSRPLDAATAGSACRSSSTARRSTPRTRLARGRPARDRDGRRDRGLRRGAGAARAAHPLPPVKTTNDLLVVRSDAYEWTRTARWGRDRGDELPVIAGCRPLQAGRRLRTALPVRAAVAGGVRAADGRRRRHLRARRLSCAGR